jgi:hypothetical protein
MKPKISLLKLLAILKKGFKEDKKPTKSKN